MAQMMARPLLGLVLLVACTFTIVAGQRQTVEVGSTRYLVSAASPYSARLGWVLAYQYCRSQGMELLTQDTQEQAVLLHQYLATSGYEGETFWTSGNRMGSNQWLWMTTGQPYNSTFSLWQQEQPALSGANSSSCMAYQAGEWFSSECTDTRHYICQLTRCFFFSSSSRPSAAGGADTGRGGENNTNGADSSHGPTTPPPQPISSPAPSASTTAPGFLTSASTVSTLPRPFNKGSPGRPSVEPLLRATLATLTRITTAGQATTSPGTVSRDIHANNNDSNSDGNGTSSVNTSSGGQEQSRSPVFTTRSPMIEKTVTRVNRIISFPGEVAVTQSSRDGGQEQGASLVAQGNNVEPVKMDRSKELAQERLGQQGLRSTEGEGKIIDNDHRINDDDQRITDDDQRIPENDERINEIGGRLVPILNRLLAPPRLPETHSKTIIGKVTKQERGPMTLDAFLSSTNRDNSFVKPHRNSSKTTHHRQNQKESPASTGISTEQETPTEITLTIAAKDGNNIDHSKTESVDQGLNPEALSSVETTQSVLISKPTASPSQDVLIGEPLGDDGGIGDVVGGEARADGLKKLDVRESAETWQLERKETSSWPPVARRG